MDDETNAGMFEEGDLEELCAPPPQVIESEFTSKFGDILKKYKKVTKNGDPT